MFSESENAAGKKTVEKTSCVEQEGETSTSPQKRKGPQIHKCRRFTRTLALTSKEAYWSETEYVIFKVGHSFHLVLPKRQMPMQSEGRDSSLFILQTDCSVAIGESGGWGSRKYHLEIASGDEIPDGAASLSKRASVFDSKSTVNLIASGKTASPI